MEGMLASAGDGGLEIDNDPIEGTVRLQSVGKRSGPFCGEAEAWGPRAMVCKGIESCRRPRIDP